MPYRPTACTFLTLALPTSFLRRLRSLNGNNLGPAVGMAFAEALEGNTTLTFLGSAALPCIEPTRPCFKVFHSLHASVYFTPSYSFLRSI